MPSHMHRTHILSGSRQHECDVTSRQTNVGSHISVYVMEEDALTHAQNAPLEWNSSTPGQGVMRRL